MTAHLPSIDNIRVAVIGLGYVGLPLAVEFGKKYPTVGFDIKQDRVKLLQQGIDTTGEVQKDDLHDASHLTFSFETGSIRDCNVYIVSVPTPIDAYRQPDLKPLLRASELVAGYISPGNVVIFESTVYPGATEEDCIPLIEKVSGLSFNKDFFAGYSPERINPGDKARPLTKIVKITSGSTTDAADFVDHLYKSIIEAGTYKASSLRVAEAAKIIENTQRDVNIALINELSMVLSKLNIDTTEVLEAAATKWNFVNLRPGLVGGHCIGVDPYYLVHRASAAGFIPNMIRLAREINDGMAAQAASILVKSMIRKGLPVAGAKALILGLTFKENCPDTRNTKVVDMIQNLQDYGVSCDIYDPWADPAEAREEYGVELLTDWPDSQEYDAVVLAVPHTQFMESGKNRLLLQTKDQYVFFDMKAAFPISESDVRL